MASTLVERALIETDARDGLYSDSYGDGEVQCKTHHTDYYDSDGHRVVATVNNRSI